MGGTPVTKFGGGKDPVSAFPEKQRETFHKERLEAGVFGSFFSLRDHMTGAGRGVTWANRTCQNLLSSAVIAQTLNWASARWYQEVGSEV